jgi:hypothetical protein
MAMKLTVLVLGFPAAMIQVEMAKPKKTAVALYTIGLAWWRNLQHRLLLLAALYIEFLYKKVAGIID